MLARLVQVQMPSNWQLLGIYSPHVGGNATLTPPSIEAVTGLV